MHCCVCTLSPPPHHHHTPPTLSDVEVTDRNNQFYEKFSMRQNIGDILMHCWTLQPHRWATGRGVGAGGGRNWDTAYTSGRGGGCPGLAAGS